MKTYLVTSLRALALWTLLVGLLYPLAITGVARAVFPAQANGSLSERNGVVVGSTLLAQKVEDAKYFRFRPSAADYGTVASGASNLSPASPAFAEAVAKRRAETPNEATADLLTTSGSGLDPHLTPEGAEAQVARVATARHLPASDQERLRQWIHDRISAPTLGILGQRRVNVMELNLALDAAFPFQEAK